MNRYTLDAFAFFGTVMVLLMLLGVVANVIGVA